MSSPTDWGQFYQQSPSNQVAPLGRTLSGTVFGGDRVSEASAVTTTISSATAQTLLGSANSGPSGVGGHLSPEGRVSKPVRRRSRASRRTPTTLLNTDTTNFRAMVQQFTGGPSAPYAAAGSQLSATNFSFGLGLRQAANVNPITTTPVMVSPAAAGYHLQYLPQQHKQQDQQQYQHQSEPRAASYMFSLGNNNNNSFGHSGHDFFLQRLGTIPARPAATSMEAVSSDGFLMEGVGVSSQVPPHPPPPPRPFLQ